MHVRAWKSLACYFHHTMIGMPYFSPLKLAGRIGMQQRSRYHLFLNNTLIMIVNVFYCVQVRSFGQVVGMHISCIWMSLFKWDEYFYHVVWWRVTWIYREGMLFLHFGRSKTTTEKTIPVKRCQSQSPTGVVLDKKKDWRWGWVYSEMCFVCVTLELAGLFESGVGVRIKLDLIWIRPLGSTSWRLLRCSMNVI